MSKSSQSTNQIQEYKKRQAKLCKLLFEQPSLFMLTPIQVLMVSLIFIGNVFLLHIFSKFVPSSSAIQIVIAIVVMIVSVFFSFYMNNKK